MMNQREIAVLMEGAAGEFHAFLVKALEPIGRRLAALEKRLDELPAAASPADVATLADTVEKVREIVTGLPGPDGLIALVEKTVSAALPAVPTAEEIAAHIPAPQPGKGLTVDDVRPLVGDVVAAAMATLRVPEDGKSVDPAAIKTMVDEAAASLPKVQEIDREDLAAIVAAQVEKAMAILPQQLEHAVKTATDALPRTPTAQEVAEFIPAPQPGKSITAEDVRPLVSEVVAAAVAALPVPKDGESVDPAEVKAMLEGAIAGLPGPKEIDREELARMVSDAVGSALEAAPKMPTAAEVAALVPPPEPGKDADPQVVAALVVAEVGKAFTGQPPIPTAEEVAALLPKPRDGKSVSMDDVRPLIDDAIAGAFATIRVPKDGKDVDPDEVRAMVAEAVKALPKLENGKDAAPEQITAAVEKVLGTWPKPKDGKSVTIDELRPVIAKAVGEMPAPKDGVGVAGALRDHEGCLVLTLTDGTLVKLGRVDGEPGKPGLDGLGFDDFEVIDGGTEFMLRLARGEKVKEWRLAKPTLADCYRGVWREGAFKKGDAVTWGGSLFIAQADTEAKPESGDDWKLAVKRGRDGKDAEPPREPAKVKLK